MVGRILVYGRDVADPSGRELLGLLLHRHDLPGFQPMPAAYRVTYCVVPVGVSPREEAALKARLRAARASGRSSRSLTRLVLERAAAARGRRPRADEQPDIMLCVKATSAFGTRTASVVTHSLAVAQKVCATASRSSEAGASWRRPYGRSVLEPEESGELRADWARQPRAIRSVEGAQTLSVGRQDAPAAGTGRRCACGLRGSHRRAGVAIFLTQFFNA